MPILNNVGKLIYMKNDVAINRPNKIGTKTAPTATLNGASKNADVSLAAKRDFVLRELTFNEDPDNLVAEVYRWLHDTGDLPQKMTQDLGAKVAIALGFENDYALSVTLGTKHAGLGIELRRQLIKDFQCSTHADKVLVDTVVCAYVRYMTCVESFQSYLNDVNFLSHEQTQFIGVLSKEMERANRQMLTAYQMLVNRKQPPLQVQINMKNAFLANNQQINTTVPVTQENTNG